MINLNPQSHESKITTNSQSIILQSGQEFRLSNSKSQELKITVSGGGFELFNSRDGEIRSESNFASNSCSLEPCVNPVGLAKHLNLLTSVQKQRRRRSRIDQQCCLQLRSRSEPSRKRHLLKSELLSKWVFAEGRKAVWSR